MSHQGRDVRLWSVETPEAIRSAFESLAKVVVCFAGYGELGYENPSNFRQIAFSVLSSWNPTEILVHSGTLLRVGGHAGVTEIYSIAKELGIETSGVHPSVAMQFAETHRVSPDCDHVFFVEDETWGGLLDKTGEPSPTLRMHLDVSDELVVIGGGKHAADELKAFAAVGKAVQYFPAEMNHEYALRWSREVGVSIPDMRGAALRAWESDPTIRTPAP